MRIYEAGVITTSKGDSLRARVEHLSDQVEAICRRASDLHGPITAVIEDPTGAGRDHRRDVTKLFAAYAAICVGVRSAGVGRVIDARASVWTRSFPKGGPQKASRIASAAFLYKIDPEDLGPSRSASDVADALLMGVWASGRVDKDCVLVCFDPSIAKTGYAIVGV